MNLILNQQAKTKFIARAQRNECPDELLDENSARFVNKSFQIPILGHSTMVSAMVL